MIGLLSIKSKTAKEIARQLEIPIWYKVIPPDATWFIRWGNTKFDILSLNDRKAIYNASHKKLGRELLRQANIPIPKDSQTEFPIVGRIAKHKGGRGFFYCQTPEDIEMAKRNGAVYFSTYYPKQNEYRVHIGSNKVLLFSIKVGDKSKLIWNKKSGFTFRHMKRSEWLNNPKLYKMQKACKKALKTLELDFGAVDVLADAKGDYPDFVISEINTAPALSPLAITKYIKYFTNKILDFNTLHGV